MIQKPLNSVKKFHNAFNIDVANSPTIKLKDAKIELRHKLMQEENEEYLIAAKNNDLVEVADALGDMLYILCGTIDAIQDSNMSKLGKNGKPIYREDGKVLKGPNYFKPNIKKIFSK